MMNSDDSDIASSDGDGDFGSTNSGSSDFEDDVIVRKKTAPKKTAAAKGKATPAKKGKENKEPAGKRKPKTDTSVAPAAKKTKAADKAAKPAVVSDAKAIDIIKDYMLKANRPYSHLNVYDNLHGVVKKPSVPKILNQLCEEGILQLKDFGKVRIYLANQSNFADVDGSEMNAMDAEIVKLQQVHSNRKEELKRLQSRVATLKLRPTITELRDQVERMRSELAEKEELFAELATADEPLISKEDFAKIRQNHHKYVKMWKQRRRACNEMLDCILESGSMKKADLEEEIGIETDAASGIIFANHCP